MQRSEQCALPLGIIKQELGRFEDALAPRMALPDLKLTAGLIHLQNASIASAGVYLTVCSVFLF